MTNTFFSLYGFSLLSGFLKSTSSTFTLKVVTGSFALHANIAVFSQVFRPQSLRSRVTLSEIPHQQRRDTISELINIYSPTFSQQRYERRWTRGVRFALARTDLAAVRLNRLRPARFPKPPRLQRAAQLPKSSR